MWRDLLAALSRAGLLPTLCLLVCATIAFPSVRGHRHPRPRCVLRDDAARLRRIQAIKQQILDKLGMSHLPSISGPHPDQVPDDVLYHYRAAVERKRRRRREIKATAAANGERTDEYFSKRLIDIPLTAQTGETSDNIKTKHVHCSYWKCRARSAARFWP